MKIYAEEKEYLQFSFGKGKKEKVVTIWMDASGGVVVEVEKNKQSLLKKVFVPNDNIDDDDSSKDGITEE